MDRERLELFWAMISFRAGTASADDVALLEGPGLLLHQPGVAPVESASFADAFTSLKAECEAEMSNTQMLSDIDGEEGKDE